MRCRKVRKRLPLFIGGDLGPRAVVRIQRHLASCRECREEEKLFRLARAAAVTRLETERVEWDHSSWASALTSAVGSGVPSRGRPRFFRPAWALALTAAAALVLSVVLFRSAGAPGADPADGAGQSVLAVTFVSPDTGLKVNWFFNREFTLEEKKP